jgi:hypothetical protein
LDLSNVKEEGDDKREDKQQMFQQEAPQPPSKYDYQPEYKQIAVVVSQKELIHVTVSCF